jgi:formylglycine-generating enzyme
MRTISLAAVLALLCGAPAAAQQSGAWRDPGSGIEFVWIAQGCFQMGSNEPTKYVPGEQPLPPMANEAPRHEACVDGFWMGKLEVTRAQWQKVMHESSANIEHPQRPAAHVTREDALRFVERLNAQGGGKRFRLPTEAEWEYACRAGTSEEPLPQTLNDAHAVLKSVAWYDQLTHGTAETRDVATLSANAWGLHDMLGNVLEWVEDTYLENGYVQHARHNPKVTQGGERFVLRGGSFKSEWWNTRCGARMFGVPNDRLWVVGLRVVREADKK